jgi:ribosomal protein S18 acetylase RimI-like enzyme
VSGVAKSLLIREAKDEDWRAILRIQQSDSVFPFIGHPHRPSERRVRERWIARLAEPRVRTLVAVSVSGDVVGYIRMKRGEGLGSHAGEISSLAVHPDYQKQGIGRRLIEEILGVANGLSLRRLWLTVHEDNYAAIHLYEHMGFDVEGKEREAVRRGRKFICLLVMGRLEPRKRAGRS